jgi:hypothetical protein
MRLVETLASFNRKERFFLVGWALGNPRFTLSESFRHELGKAIDVVIPAHAFAAMDYHLDWIYASLFLCARLDAPNPYENTGHISATQEDVDLLVAFDERDTVHLILLEAKGATGWTNAQLASKADRLRAIFGDDGAAWEGVTPPFLIVSPVRSNRLRHSGWPGWMAPGGGPVWLPMPMSPGLRRITRCDEQGRPAIRGTFWTVVP